MDYQRGDPDPNVDFAASGARLTDIQVVGSTETETEFYTVHEALGSRTEQDLWNRQPMTYPYGTEGLPRITRIYRCFYDDVFTLEIGHTPDTEYPDATLFNLQNEDESTVTKKLTAFFDDIPEIEYQEQSGNGDAGLGLSITYPLGTTTDPLLTYRARVFNSAYVPATDNQACPIPGYTTLKLSDQAKEPAQDAPTVSVMTLTYENIPGSVLTSDIDASKLPRQLTPTPAYYLNNRTLTTTKQVVAYGTAPDPRGGLILSSKVEAATKLKAIKTNVLLDDTFIPDKYLPKQVGEADGADGEEYRIEILIADSGNGPTNETNLRIAIDGAIMLMGSTAGTAYNMEFRTNPISPTEAELIYTLVPTFPLRTGQRYNPQLSAPLVFTERLMSNDDADEVKNDPNTTVELVPGQSDLRRVRVDALPTSTLNTYLRSRVRMTSIRFPDVLLAIIVFWNTGGGDGSNTETGSGVASGDGGSINLNTSNSAEGARDVLPDIQEVFAPRPQADNRQVTDYHYYAPINSSYSQLLTTLKSLIAENPNILPWPIFKPQSHTFILQGQKLSVRASAQARITASGTSYATSSGQGSSYSPSTMTRAVTIRESIHGSITLSSTSMSATASAQASTSLTVGELTASGGAASPANQLVTGSISPSGVAATPGLTAIPTSGLYALDVDVEPSEFTGYDRVRVPVFDASSLASTPVVPINVQAAVSGTTTSLKVSWVDAAYDATLFKILRSTTPTGTFTQIGSVGGTVFSYLDSGLASATTYYYKVVANNTSGDSAASMVGTGTTL